MKVWSYVCCLCVLIALPSFAQQYGVGLGLQVPYVAPGTLHLDGTASEAAWSTASVVDLTKNWSGDWSGHPYPDVTATAKLLWTDDTLFVYAEIQDYEPFYWGNADSSSPWGGEQILIGVDDTHAKDDTMSGGWEGWPENAPDKGPTCYKIWMDDITLNWGQLGFSPRWDSGWTPGTIFVDNVNFKWGVEMGIYLPHAHDGGSIGFNIGGASADSAWADSNDWNGDGAYGWFSWQSVEYAGGDVQYNSASFATLNLTKGEMYGVRLSVPVPQVAPGTLQLDGNASEGAWANATVVDLTKNWSGDWSGHPYPDVTATAKLLWTDDTLFVYAEIQDYEPFYWGNADSSSPWGGEQILIGVDDTHAKDDTMSGGWEGWPENAPDKGPTCYKVWMDDITLNWGQLGFSPRWDSGWTPGTIFVDNVNFKWGVEMGIYLPHAHEGGSIGFNIGGASADSAWADSNDWNGDGAYGWFSWQSVEYAGGDVQYNSASYATLKLSGPVTGVKGTRPGSLTPAKFALNQNYPNPFNPSTKISYELPRESRVVISIYNILGERVAVLVDERKPAGNYETMWTPATLVSGVYFYDLNVDGKMLAVRKMMLIK